MTVPSLISRAANATATAMLTRPMAIKNPARSMAVGTESGSLCLMTFVFTTCKPEG